MCPPSKKQRVKRNANLTQDQRPVGKNQFLDLPLDLIIEVFQYLEPVDILYLSRTTKGLRTFLFDRHKSLHIWKAALGNVPDFPPCPDHLSTPAYTHLAFVPVCHGCFKPCHTIEWEIRMRCCQKCLRKMTVPPSSSHDDNILHRVYSVRLPVAESHLEWIERDISVVDVALSPCHHPSDWETLWKRAKRTTRATQKFVDKENKVWAPIVEHARLCREWQHKRLNEQATRLRLVREDRANNIKKNLKDLGWTDDSYYSTAFLQLAEVNRAEPLTPAEWSKISSKLVASLPKVRRAHMAEIYHSRLMAFRAILPHTLGLRVRPRAIDMFLLPEVRDVLENDINTEMSAQMMSQKFGPVLPELMRRWCDEAVNALALLARQWLGSESDVDPFNAVFQCNDCLHKIDLDEALSHSHLYQDLPTAGRKRLYTRMRESRIYEEVGKEVYWSDIRAIGVLRVDKAASKARNSVINAHRGDIFSCAWCIQGYLG